MSKAFVQIQKAWVWLKAEQFLLKGHGKLRFNHHFTQIPDSVTQCYTKGV